MRLSAINAYVRTTAQPQSQTSRNISFGTFTEEADIVARAKMKPGPYRLCEADYEILGQGPAKDVVLISSKGDTLKAVKNKAYFTKLIEEYGEKKAKKYEGVFDEWVEPEKLANAHEKDNLKKIATAIFAMYDTMHDDLHPKPPKPVQTSEQMRKEFWRELKAKDAQDRLNWELWNTYN